MITESPIGDTWRWEQSVTQTVWRNNACGVMESGRRGCEAGTTRPDGWLTLSEIRIIDRSEISGELQR